MAFGATSRIKTRRFCAGGQRVFFARPHLWSMTRRSAKCLGRVGQPGDGLVSRSDRSVDIWGVSLESSWSLTPIRYGRHEGPPPTLLGCGRRYSRHSPRYGTSRITGLKPRLQRSLQREPRYEIITVSTLHMAGRFSPFLLRGLWQKWGLQSSFRVQGGLYYADFRI